MKRMPLFTLVAAMLILCSGCFLHVDLDGHGGRDGGGSSGHGGRH